MCETIPCVGSIFLVEWRYGYGPIDVLVLCTWDIRQYLGRIWWVSYMGNGRFSLSIVVIGLNEVDNPQRCFESVEKVTKRAEVMLKNWS